MSNDRFKFRVWDGHLARYTMVDPAVKCLDGKIREIAMCNDDSNRYIIEQCTGVKDRNGKLIFEGDIVRYMSRGIEFEGVVTWITGIPYQYEEFGGWIIEITKNKKWEHMDYSRDWESFEVVGNIHEVTE